jgi:hypothetical protein
MASFEGQLADAIISAAEANKATIIAAVTTAEGGVTQFITAALNQYKPGGAILPLVWDALKPAIVNELVSLESQESGAAIFALLDAEAHAFAKTLGG